MSDYNNDGVVDSDAEEDDTPDPSRPARHYRTSSTDETNRQGILGTAALEYCGLRETFYSEYLHDRINAKQENNEESQVHLKLQDMDIAKRHSCLKNMFIHLNVCLQGLPAGHVMREPLEAYIRRLDKKVHPRCLEKWLYRQASESELLTVIELTFCLALIARSQGARDGMFEAERTPLFLNKKVYPRTAELARRFSPDCCDYKSVLGHLALTVLGIVTVVGAVCVTAVTYGSTAPFALAVAKFGFDLMCVSAAYVFYELAMAIGRKCLTKRKAIQGSTSGVIKDLGYGTGAGVVTCLLTTLPRTASANSDLIMPIVNGGISKSFVAMTPFAVSSVITAAMVSAVVGLFAMKRGVSYLQDTYVRCRMRRDIEKIPGIRC